MKKLILGILLSSAVSISAFAANNGGTVGSDGGQRAFRVLPEAVDGGYAIGWGSPGKIVNFEELDKDSSQVEQFLKSNSLRNYLIDLETNTVLYTLSPMRSDGIDEDFVDFSLAGRPRFERLTLVRLNVNALNPGEDIILAVHHLPYYNRVDFAAITKRDNVNNASVLKELDDSQIEGKMKAALRHGLSTSQKIV